MARVFLSYARNDVERAKPLAGALERAGHAVWWDRHIEGGSDYSREIDAALKRADAIVVLWSSSSIDSAWVRDEAAAGRDTGRLVPVLVEDVEPPLGFRQYQAIDLSRWKGRGQSGELKKLKAAIAAKGSRAAAPEATPAAPIQEAAAQRKNLNPLVYLLFAALVLAAGVFAVQQWSGKWWGDRETASLAVLPFHDMSGEGDQAYFAEGVAEEIRSILSEHSNIRVVGRTSSSKFSENDADVAAIRRALASRTSSKGVSEPPVTAYGFPLA